jgi:hypothetical protein
MSLVADVIIRANLIFVMLQLSWILLEDDINLATRSGGHTCKLGFILPFRGFHF